MSKIISTRFAFSASVFTSIAFISSAIAGSERLSDKTIAAAPPMAPEFSWTGFYLGGHLGAQWGSFDFGSYSTSVDADSTLGAPEAALAEQGPSVVSVVTLKSPKARGQDDDSLLGGGQGGFNWQWNRFVIGVEGDFSRTAASSSTSSEGSRGGGNFPTFFFISDITSMRRAEIDWTASARLRLGYTWGRVMFYATGGPAWADASVTATDKSATTLFFGTILSAPAGGAPTGAIGGGGLTAIGPFISTNVSRASDTRLGWTGGGGIEWAVNDWVSLGMEYRHADYGSETYSFVSNNNGGITTGRSSVDLQSDQVTLKMNLLLSGLFHR